MIDRKHTQFEYVILCMNVDNNIIMFGMFDYWSSLLGVFNESVVRDSAKHG